MVLGLSGFMLMGVAVCGALSHHSSSRPSHDVQSRAVAFGPALKPAGLRPATRAGGLLPAPIAQAMDQASLTREARVRQAVVRMSANDADDSAAKKGEASMASVAVAAMDPSLDAEKRAKLVAEQSVEMKDQDKWMLQMAKREVLRKAKNMPGVTDPLGFFDPLGFTTDISEGKLYFYREVEVKHGRVAMLASLGFIVGEQFHPLWGGNVDVPSYIAFQETPLQNFWPAVVAAIAIPEVFSVFDFKNPLEDQKWADGKEEKAFWTMKTDREPGDMGFDPLGLKPKLPADLKEMQTKELNNGRLAMIAAAGMVAQELASGKKLFFDNPDPFATFDKF
jgi:light-harvesting complex I chlorophyll a/b binding protein 4